MRLTVTKNEELRRCFQRMNVTGEFFEMVVAETNV